MDKIKFALRKFIPGLIMLHAGSLSAYIHPEAASFAIQAEFLYLYPSFDESYYVLNSRSSSSAFPYGDRITNAPGFSPAFRIEGFYGFCNPDQDLKLSWTYLHTESSSVINGGRLFQLCGLPAGIGFGGVFTGFATDNLDILYQNVEGLFEQKIFDRGFGEIYFQAGLHYLYTRSSEDVFYRTSAGAFERLNYKGWMFGGGPEIGLESNWALCDINCFCPGRLSLTCGSTFSFLMAAEKTHLFVRGGNGSYRVKDKTTWRGVPAWYTFLGFNYFTCYKRYPVALEVGYEFSYYTDCISQLRSVDDFSECLSVNVYKSLGLHGPYASAGVSF